MDNRSNGKDNQRGGQRSGTKGGYGKPSGNNNRSYDKKPSAPRAGGYGRPSGDNRSFEKKPYTPREGGYGRPAGDNRSFEKKPFTPREGGYGRPSGDNRSFEKKPYTPREGGSGRPSGDNRSFEKKPFTPREGGFGRPSGDNRSFEKKPFTPREGGFGRPSGDNRSFEKKPYTPREGGFGRPSGEKRSFDKKPAEPAYSAVRMAALEAFEAVMHEDAFASMSIDDTLRAANLSQLDKRLCTSIVYLTLENLTRIDFALNKFLQESESLPPRVRDILRISASQILFQDKVPDSAAVNEAVKLTRTIGAEGLTGLVNGVLRNLIRQIDEIEWPKPEEGAHYLSVMFSVPLWLCEKLIAAYGEETAKEICAFRTDKHFMTLRPNMMQLTDAQLEELLEKKVWDVTPGSIPHAYRVREASEIARDLDYLAGKFSIQGESSMLAAQALDVRRGMQVLDCCAAPGGKTAYIAETLQGTGRVYAWDLHEHRVALIRAMMKRLRLDNIRPAVRDATQLKEDLIGMLDAVLLDAPCSGLGVMDNKPDIKHRVTEQSIEELVALQRQLMDTCSQYVKRGGTFVYSTCSFLPEENTEQVKRFLLDHPEFVLASLPASMEERFRAEAGEYGLQLLPHRDGVEGFFIARMKKVK